MRRFIFFIILQAAALIHLSAASVPGNLEFYLIYFMNGPEIHGNSEIVQQRRIYFDLDDAKVKITAVAQNIATGITYSTVLKDSAFTFRNIPAGSYLVHTVPDFSRFSEKKNATVLQGQTTGIAEEIELDPRYAGRLKLSLTAAPGILCSLAVGFSSDKYTMQDDNIRLDTISGPKVYEKVLEYYPLPWGSFTCTGILTGNAVAESPGNLEINVNNPTVQSWMTVTPSH